VHPAAVLRAPDRQDELDSGLKRFIRVINGESSLDVETDIDHRVVYKQRELSRIVDEILEAPGDEIILAVDAEWHGENPWEPGSYLRSIQISHKPKFAACIVLHGEGGVPEFVPSMDAVTHELKRLVECPDKKVRVGGHFFRADIPWILDKLNVDLRPYYAPGRDEISGGPAGGFDTALMAHSVFETARFKLEDLAVRLTTCPRWDVDLQAWKKSYCSTNGLKDKDLEGYGECPSEILHPYACYDADATRRLYDVFSNLLDSDVHGNNCRKAYVTSHSASLAVLEMERYGLGVDLSRAEDLIRTFSEARALLLQELRQDINWPDFNPASAPHCRALLFGDEHAKKVDKSDGFINVRPEDATTLGLTPITTTGQRPKSWEYVSAQGRSVEYVPSTNGETLGILGQQNPIAARVRDIRFLEQVLKTTLRHPEQDADGTPLVDPETGRSVYSSGLLSYIGGDERIHTHLMQTMETGRFSSSRPNLQNISKRREDDYKRILGSHYKYPIRTIFTARPGYVFIEADYTGAELAGIMWMAQDENGIDHVRRNMLSADHPDYYDIHSQAAVSAFNLDCAPTKRGLKEAGCPGMRVAAKNVNFGIPYGRGPAALARQCREEGVELTEYEAQKLIDNYFETYPSTKFFLGDCRARVVNPGWMCNAFGRYRRFPDTNDRSVLGELERQAQNFPIQSLVADAMSRAIYYLYDFRERELSVDFDIVLQIHDAVLLEVPVEHVERVCDEVLPYCMTEMVPIVPTDLNGQPLPDGVGPYYLKGDRDISVHWGENLTVEQARELGVPERLI
jgi:DNA polymerase I-like protein with 3'-5' exonuclease and polymerase domains